MAVSIQNIIEARRPSTVIDSRVNTLIALAKEQTDATAWGDFYNQGVALLTCHWLELDSRSASAVGGVTAEREGQLSRSYGGVNSVDEELGSTIYGAEYLRLRRTIPSFLVRGMDEMPKSNNASF
jgi:hypothetical protein